MARNYVHPTSTNRIIRVYPYGGLPKEYIAEKKRQRISLCKWCGGVVSPPRRTWCCERCVNQYRLRNDLSYARALVYARDLGHCIICEQEGYYEEHDTWEMDHILPVSEGGGECGLDNYRTLCKPHHQLETNKLRARIKARKRKKKQDSILQIGLFDDDLFL